MKPIVVYIDDLEDNDILFRAELKNTEFEIISFTNPLVARDTVPTIKPCIIVCDQRMPQIEGTKLLEDFKTTCPKSIRIMITGYSNEKVALDAFQKAEVFGYVKKPLIGGEVEKTIKAAYAKYLKDNADNPSSGHGDIEQIKEDLNKATSSSELHRIAQLFQDSFEKLGANVPQKKIEEWSILVTSVMSGRWRRYHTCEHIFNMASSGHPIEVLVAIFHDLAYLQVDRRIHPLLSAYLPEFKIQDMTGLEVKPNTEIKVTVEESNEAFDLKRCHWVYRIFGLKVGDVLNQFTGVNEFLSALFAMRLLKDYLKDLELIDIAIAIEATRPFRNEVNNRKTPENSRHKLINLCADENVDGLKYALIEEIITRSVIIANRDVGSFGDNDVGKFLAGTWDLILEGNAIFYSPVYTITDYREALCKVEGFFQTLTPEKVFKQYNGYIKNYTSLISNCTFNLVYGIHYLSAKQIPLALQEAIAVLTGGIAPITLFNGKESKNPSQFSNNLDHYLDYTVPVVPETEKMKGIFELLSEGRGGKDGFDTDKSPLAAYFYSRMTAAQRNLALENSKLYFEKKMTPMELMRSFPQKMVLSLLNASIETVPTRKAELTALKEKFID